MILHTLDVYLDLEHQTIFLCKKHNNYHYDAIYDYN